MGLRETEKTECSASCGVEEQMGQRNRGLNVAWGGQKRPCLDLEGSLN